MILLMLRRDSRIVSNVKVSTNGRVYEFDAIVFREKPMNGERTVSEILL